MTYHDFSKQTLPELEHNLNALEFSRNIREITKTSYTPQKAKLLKQIEKLTTPKNGK